MRGGVSRGFQNTHFSRTYSVCTWDSKSASSISALEANRRKGLHEESQLPTSLTQAKVHIQEPHHMIVCGGNGGRLEGRARLGTLEREACGHGGGSGR